MPIKIKERFLYYPIAFTILFLILILFFNDVDVLRFFDEFLRGLHHSLFHDLEFKLPYIIVFVGVFGYITGYVYGFFSLFFRIRMFLDRPLLVPILFVLKLAFSIIHFYYGVIAFLIEIIILPFAILIKKIIRKRRIKKRLIEEDSEIRELNNQLKELKALAEKLSSYKQ